MASSKPTPTPAIIGVIGIRDFKGKIYSNRSYIGECVSGYAKARNFSHYSLVTGGGKGVEEELIKWAGENDISIRTISPNSQTPEGFAHRNNMIVAQSEMLLMFWDGYVMNLVQPIANAVSHGRECHVFPVR